MKWPLMLRSTHIALVHEHAGAYLRANQATAEAFVRQTRETRAAQKGLLRLQRRHKALKREHAALQAKLDRLMLEYCPDEMTPEQLAEWEAHQQGVK